MLQKKIKSKIIQPRSQLELHSVRINNFLFTKTKIKQNGSFFQQKKQIEHNKSLRISLKSDFLQKKQASKSLNIAYPLHTQINTEKTTNNHLTNRILKLQHLRHKKIYFNQKQFGQYKVRMKTQNIESHHSFLKPNNNIKIGNNQLVDFKVSRSKSLRNNLQTKNIFQSYKLTRRIVYFQQIQQKKERQKLLMDSDSRTKTYTNKNIEQKKLQKQQKKLNQLIIKANLPCRPWSGQSRHANVQIPVDKGNQNFQQNQVTQN